MKVVFSGGGTLGPVTPLLALIETARARGEDHEFLWIGTERGVELPLLRKFGVAAAAIPSGKFRRYVDVRNVTDLWHIVRGVRAARVLLKEFAPDVCVTAGGYVSVPVHLAARTLGIPTVVHQQDVQIGLANRIMSRWATVVTATLSAHAQFFGAKKTVVTGNPVRPSVLEGSRERAIERFHLDPDRATVFCFGGGTGAASINTVVSQMARECNGLFQIIHLTGMERGTGAFVGPFYHSYPFFTTEMADAYACADVVISRAGFNAISEAAAWGKPMILIPIGHSHQEKNAAWAQAHGAALVLENDSLTSAQLFDSIRGLLADPTAHTEMAQSAKLLLPDNAAVRVWEEITGVCQQVG